MSWGFSVKARKFAVSGELAARFTAAKKQLEGYPTEQRIVAFHQQAVDELVKLTPHDCDIRVDSNGHGAQDGSYADSTLKFWFGPHVDDRPKAAPAAAAAEQPAA